MSRSSALASKASGYPIARISAKIAVGLHLNEISIANALASFEPSLDYVVAKMPRFPFDKFADANNKLSTQMKATGEVMSIGRTLEECLLKAIRSLEIGAYHLHLKKFDTWEYDALLDYIKIGTDDRIFAIAKLLRLGTDLGVICNATGIDMLFLEKFKNIVAAENEIKEAGMDASVLLKAKRMGFCDRAIADLWGVKELDVYEMRKLNRIFPVYKMIDTCAAEFEGYIPYLYSTYE